MWSWYIKVSPSLPNGLYALPSQRNALDITGFLVLLQSYPIISELFGFKPFNIREMLNLIRTLKVFWESGLGLASLYVEKGYMIKKFVQIVVNQPSGGTILKPCLPIAHFGQWGRQGCKLSTPDGWFTKFCTEFRTNSAPFITSCIISQRALFTNTFLSQTKVNKI